MPAIKASAAQTSAAKAKTAKPASAKGQPSALAVQSWMTVVRAYNLCDAVLNQRLATLDLRLPEHEVLANLLRLPGITQQQLAQRCFVAKSGVSMLVGRMEDAGLVRREADAADARLKRLFLTHRGQQLAEQAQSIQNAVVLAMVGQISDAELTTVAQAMQNASSALELMLSAV
jgi:DNA-binding MarR family transcriptional regulator